MKVTWIASYPKSGNTWLRFLLYHYLYGALPDSASLSRRIPDVHRAEVPKAEVGGDRLLVKTHFPLSPLVPLLKETAGAIHVIRHPKDVLFSCLNYHRLSGQFSEMPDADYAKIFIGAGGDPIFLRMGFGTWEQHVHSWCMQRRIPLCFLRYGDLKKDTGKALRQILQFLNEPIDDERVARAVDASSFERMRAMEAEEKRNDQRGTVFAGDRRSLERGCLFMNKGGFGQSLLQLGADIDAAFDRRFAQSLWLLGYGSTALSSA